MAGRRQFCATWAATTRWWLHITKRLQHPGKLSKKVYFATLHLNKMKLRNANLLLYLKLSAPACIPNIFQSCTWQSRRRWESTSWTSHFFTLLSPESHSWYSSHILITWGNLSEALCDLPPLFAAFKDSPLWEKTQKIALL